MKKMFTLFFLLLFVNGYSQSFTWQWLNPKPHGNAMRSVKVIAPNTVIAFGAAGTVQKSTNNGTTWSVKNVDTLGREFRAAHFFNATTGFVCGSGGLLMKTVDGGETFTYVTSGTTNLLYDIEFVDANVGYASGSSGTMIKTTDGGATWSNLTTGTTLAIYGLSAPAPDVVYFGTASSPSVFRKSTDGGATWTTVTPSGLTQSIWGVHFINTTTGWIATQNGGRVYATTDGGTTWTNSITDGLVVPNAVYFANATTGYVTNNNNGKVFVTTDAGATWTFGDGTTEPQYAAVSSGSDVFSVGRSGTTTKSTDGGTTYTLMGNAVTITQIRKIKFINATLGIGTAGSTTTGDSLGFLIKTTDGGNTWNQLPYNFKNIVYSLATPTPTTWYVGRGRNAIFKTTDAGATFVEQTQPTTGTHNFLDISFADENNGYAVTSTGGVIKTTDGGTTWTNANTPFGTTSVSAAYVFSPNKVIAVAQSAKAFMTTNGGTSWEALTTNIPGNFFTVNFYDENFGVIAGFNSPSPVASKTTDGGATWTALTLPGDFDGNSIWGIGFRNTNTFWLGGINGAIYYTTDGGTSWTSSKPVTGNTLYSFAIVGDEMWLSGTQGTILKGYSSPFIPVNMVSFNASINGNEVNLSWKTATETNNKGFDVERNDGQSWSKIAFVTGNGTTTEANTYSYLDKPESKGLIKYRLKQIDFDGTYEYSDIVEVNVGAPVKFDLAQNYPNPFNPVTTIKYSLASKANVELKIYNILGKEVARIVNEVQDAGNYSIEFNASKFASGVYFYELNAGTFNSKKKMILIK
ncbi:MAG TPA: hypothetical protein DCY06_12270 [Bacteroidetes bacterium]|nr:hypothetical protein [Bacteroidota bacterium]HRI45550.1 YCF48-related protein [Ignavibacteriaceae bacterium]